MHLRVVVYTPVFASLLSMLAVSCSQKVSERSIGTLVLPAGVDMADFSEDQGGGRYALVANFGDDSLAVADLDKREFLDFVPGDTLRRNGLPLGGMPLFVKVAEDNGRAYVVTAERPELIVVDLPSFKELERVGLSEGASPDCFMVYHAGGKPYGLVSRPVQGMIEVVDLDAGKLVATWYLDDATPRGLAACPDGSCLFVADSEGRSVIELTLDTTNGLSARPAGSYDVGGPTRRVAVSPSGRFLYALRSDGPYIAVVDLESGEHIDANPETKALDQAEGNEHEKDIRTGAVPLEIEMVSFEFKGRDLSVEPEAVDVAFVIDYEGNLWGFDLTRDLHKVFDMDRSTYASVSKPEYRDGSGRTIVDPGSDHPSLQAIDPEDPEDPGVQVFYRVTRSETWSVVYDGTIGGSYRQARASLDAKQRRLLAPGTDFVKAGIAPGDVIVIESLPAGDECPLVGLEEIPDIEMKISSVSKGELDYEQTDLPLDECFAGREISFRVRTDGCFSVNGSTSGFKGRARPGERYDNLLIAFTILPPANPSAEIQKGAGWTFTTSSGVEPMAVSVGSIPGGIAFSAGKPDAYGDDRIMVTNRNFGGLVGSRGGLLELDAQNLDLLVQYY